MSSLSCRQGHPNPEGSNFCGVCGEPLTDAAASTFRGVVTLHPGKKLRDRYVIQKVLGEGGFGRTYLVEDTGRFDERLVLKEFLPSNQGTATLDKSVELFRREAVTLYQLQHNQIPKFWEIFQEDSRLFLVEDFIEGQTYEALINERIRNRETFRETEVVSLLRALLPVLTYLHGQGVIHRDISPDNIILSTKTDLPILIDLGAAKQTILNATMVSAATTPRATIIGKTGYSPDEQIRLGIVAPHSDLYALAVTAIVLMTGKQPNQLLDQYTLKWNWEEQVQVTPAFAQVLNRMLSPTPNQRFQSADEAQQALASALSIAPTSVSTPTPSDAVNPSSETVVNTDPMTFSSPAISATQRSDTDQYAAPTQQSAPTQQAATVQQSVSGEYSAPTQRAASGEYFASAQSVRRDGFSSEPVTGDVVNNSGSGRIFDSVIAIPDAIKGWNWGAFLLGGFWSAGNKVWIGLICFIPFIIPYAWVTVIGWAMAGVLGVKGNEWAWKSRRWASIEQFKTHQKNWTIAGLIVLGIAAFIGFLIGLSGA